MEREPVSWEQLDEYVDALAEYVKEHNLKFSGVYGPPKGGTVIATVISYRLGIPLLAHAAEGCMIADDIADSGRTLLHYTENDTQFNKYFITTMYCHKRSVVKPDFYKFEKKDIWLFFPWSKGEELHRPEDEKKD